MTSFLNMMGTTSSPQSSRQPHHYASSWEVWVLGNAWIHAWKHARARNPVFFRVKWPSVVAEGWSLFPPFPRLDRGKWSTKGARDCSESSISHKNCAERRRRKCWAHSRCVFAWRFWLQSFCQRPKRLQTFLDSFFHFFILSFIHSFIPFHSILFHFMSFHSFIQSCVKSFIHSFIHSVIDSLIHTFISFVHSFLHSFHVMSCHVMSCHVIPSFLHSFIHSRIHSFMCSFHSVDSFLHSFFHAFHFCRPSFHFISILPSSPTIPISKMFPIVMSFFLKTSAPARADTTWYVRMYIYIYIHNIDLTNLVIWQLCGNLVLVPGN